MRLTILIFFCCFTLVKAQQLHPACQIGAKWNYIYYTGGTFPVKTYLQTIRCIKDTTIGIHQVSVLKAESEFNVFRTFTYLAKDDSNGLYFFLVDGSVVNEVPQLTFRFQDTPKIRETIKVQSYLNEIETIFPLPTKSKVYSDRGLIEFYGTIFQSVSNFIHPTYLNLSFGSIYKISYFGVLDFSRYFDSDWLYLNCYTDSSGTTKFIKENKDKGCEFTDLISISHSSQTISVFPNPFLDRLYLSESIPGSINEIEIRNVLGEMVYSSQDISRIKSLGMSTDSWPSGIYMFIIKGKETVVKGKLVKE